MLDYYSSEYKEAFDNLKKCVKNTDCKAKCINKIDENTNFLDCFNDLDVVHQDL